MMKINILPSSFRRTLPINECGEKLVDLRAECPQISFEIAEYLQQELKESKDAYFVRESVAKMVNVAQSALPDGYRLLVRCGYRTPQVQARQFRGDYADLKEQHPTWTEEQLDIEIIKRTDPPDVGPHCTGGAIDLSLVDGQGAHLNMGTKMGTFVTDTITYSDTISTKAKQNRKILIDVMQNAGFLNFPAEWWHWSYGDHEWAYANNKTTFYGQIEHREEQLSEEQSFEDQFFTASTAS